MNRQLDDLDRLHELGSHLSKRSDELIDALLQHESFETATDEIRRSIDTLANLHRELRYLRVGAVDSIAAFLPVNLPLYSLILFAVVPSLMADRVVARPPVFSARWLATLVPVLNLEQYCPRITITDIPRDDFVKSVAQASEAVLFTGRYENAVETRAQCDPERLFIYNGAGVNPIIVGPSCDLADDIARILTPRLFNSGQDCAGPDAFLVHRSKIDEFVERATSLLTTLASGDYTNHDTRLGPLLNPRPLRALRARVAELNEHVVLGGTIDVKAGIAEPTLIVRDVADHDRLIEFFAPVFYVLVYDSTDDLMSFLGRAECREFSMYTSLFGERPPAGLAEQTTVLRDRTVLEIERGNDAFGGPGEKANFVSCRGNVVAGPVLVSEAIARYLAVR